MIDQKKKKIQKMWQAKDQIDTCSHIHASSSSSVSETECWIGWTRHIAIASNLIFSKKKCQPSISILFLLRELSLSTSLILSKCLVPPPYFHHYMCCCCRFAVVPFYANYSLYTQTQLLLPTNLNYPFATAGYLHSHSLAQWSYSWHFHFY